MSNKQPILSIIITVYNMNGVLQACLDSIIEQKVSYCFQIVCVDDGSDDCSLAVLQEYTARYDNITVITQTNHGSAYAKNIGFEHSIGRYLWIINSDDCIKNGSLDSILNILANESPDVLKIGLKNISENDFSIDRIREEQHFNATPAELFLEPSKDDVSIILRADIIKNNGLHFREGMKYHYDRLFALQYWNLIDQSHIYIIKKSVYLRRQRQISEMAQVSQSQSAKERYYQDTAFMAIEYHRLLSGEEIKDYRIRQFVQEQERFFTENAIVILPSTSQNKNKELKRLIKEGVYPYPCNLQRVRKAKSVKLKILLFIRSVLAYRAVYEVYYFLQKIRKKRFLA